MIHFNKCYSSLLAFRALSYEFNTVCYGFHCRSAKKICNYKKEKPKHRDKFNSMTEKNDCDTLSSEGSLPHRIGFVGGGQMAKALAKGFMAAGLVAPEQV